MSIGIFDSGVGGLTVLKEVRKVLPNEKIIYLGDTARVPYGEKTQDLIVRYSKQIVDFLIEKKVDAIVVACNTATSLALDELNKTFKTPIIGVIEAGVRTALYTTKNNKIGVIGTKATINSKKYETEIKKRNPEIEVYSKSCPLFAPAIEEGIIKGKLINQMVQMYLDDFSITDLDSEKRDELKDEFDELQTLISEKLDEITELDLEESDDSDLFPNGRDTDAEDEDGI